MSPVKSPVEIELGHHRKSFGINKVTSVTSYLLLTTKRVNGYVQRLLRKGRVYITRVRARTHDHARAHEGGSGTLVTTGDW